MPWSTANVADLLLRQMRMQLHLIDRRNDAAPVDQQLQVTRFEIAHTDRLRATRLGDLLQRIPRAEDAVVVLQRPMDQVQVDIVDAETSEAGVERLQRRLVALIGVPQLGGEKDVFAGDSRVRDATAHPFLVAVCGGGVDVPVARLVQGEPDGVFGLVVVRLPDSQAELGRMVPEFSTMLGTRGLMLSRLSTVVGSSRGTCAAWHHAEVPQIRLFATDLDGTLLRSDRTISASHRAAMEDCATVGIEIVWATARARHSVHEFAQTMRIPRQGDLRERGGGPRPGRRKPRVHARRRRPSRCASAAAAMDRVRTLMPGVVFANIGPTRFVAEPAYAALCVFADHHRHPHEMALSNCCRTSTSRW